MNPYKRYVFWFLRVQERVPGYGRISRWQRGHYERHFWMTTLVSMVAAFGQYYIIRKLVRKWADDFLERHPVEATDKTLDLTSVADKVVGDWRATLVQDGDPDGPF